MSDEPPKDGGPLAFVGAFLATPLVVAAYFSAKEPKLIAFYVLVLGFFLVPMTLAMPFIYTARSRTAVIARATLVGVLGTAAFIAYMHHSTRDVKHDDVLPLFFVIVGPLLLAAGAMVGALSAVVALWAFGTRQRARGNWLHRVRTEGHPRYRIVPKAHKNAPPFLRFNDGDATLMRLPEGDYRDATEGVAIGRIPLT